MRTRVLLLLTMIATTLLMTLAPGATAVFVFRVEGEDRDLAAPICAFDGERMQGVPWTGASGGMALFYPNEDCYAVWTVSLSQSVSKILLGSISSGTAGDCGVWIVLVDGVHVGTTDPDCAPSDIVVLTVHRIGGGLIKIPAGPHAIVVLNDYTSGPTWANSYVDYLEFQA